jgi:hypothetical protein
VPFIDHDDVIKTLATKGTDHPLNMAILPWRPGCRWDGRDTHGLDSAPKRFAKCPMTVMDDVSWSIIPGKGLAHLLCCPGRCWVRSDREMNEFPTPMVKDNENKK